MSAETKVEIRFSADCSNVSHAIANAFVVRCWLVCNTYVFKCPAIKLNMKNRVVTIHLIH
jgi:hypothetical protein